MYLEVAMNRQGNIKRIIDKKGYLNTDYMFFHLNDRTGEEHAFHYHEFDKIVILLSGKVTYVIEGKEYHPEPWDILLVNHHNIHKPVIDSSSDYERIVIWVNHDFIASHSTAGNDLSLCFQLAESREMSLLKLPADKLGAFLECLSQLESSFHSEEFGSRIMSNAYFLQFLIMVNRQIIKDTSYQDSSLVRYDEKINEIIRYINGNLETDLSLDRLAHDFFISKSYLMHRFKEETGYTLHNYILQKRLIYSRELLKQGVPITEAALKCGFNEYTTYLRAFKKLFKCLPKDYAQL